MKTIEISDEKYENLVALGVITPEEEASEFTYPMWFKDTDSKLVVKFTGLTTGACVVAGEFHAIGDESHTWVNHTDDNHWTQVEDPDKPQHLDLVECWDDDDAHERILRFWNKDNPYGYGGEYMDTKWQNYRKIHRKDEPEWATKARKILE